MTLLVMVETLKMQHEDKKYILTYSPQEAIKRISRCMDIKKVKNDPSAAMSA